METTAREFNQNASKILAAAERGERITVTKNGRPVAILSPVTDEDSNDSGGGSRPSSPAYPFRADPMGDLGFPDLGGPRSTTTRSRRRCGTWVTRESRRKAMSDIPVTIADTKALYRMFVPKDPRHTAHRDALARVGHLVVSPLVLAELDYLLTQRIGLTASLNALDSSPGRPRHAASRFPTPPLTYAEPSRSCVGMPTRTPVREWGSRTR
ncbi:type II toxin-antitoxin system prevent-host-death family antitoxin [Streptomyces sp. NBC_00038]|uniref:type II toxin-antitoxin system prevent-host-death family antitoxin n=1 Tax=Streptomyces sp. NBC_00038 TaxID=2903615 RepID=UPI002B1D7BB6|nr:type II toxin-antitoxin system prevent-host-death family antitoxin [Streptomyces sp. NBC_00038]